MMPAYQELPFSPLRQLMVDILSISQAKHRIYALFEVDVTLLFERLEHYRQHVPVSLTAYFVYSLARAVDQHKEIHAIRKRNKLIVFDDVDVQTLLEKQKPDGTLIPVLYIVRGANHKSFAQINHEIQAASKSTLYNEEGVRRRRQIANLPALLRRWALRWTMNDPFRLKKYWGTVGLSNAGVFADARPYYPLSLTFVTCAIVIGGIYDRVCWVDNRAQPRKTLTITGMGDHDIIDGGPAGRFGVTWADLLERASGLDDDFLAEAQTLGEQAHHETNTL